jgi:glutamate carboxypeptidase
MMTEQLSFDAEQIAAGIAEWVSIESPSYDAAAVNRMMDLAEAQMAAQGAAITRHPGTQGYGDVLEAAFDFDHAADTPGILVLGHLDTVHLAGTLDSELPVRRDGDQLFGPGIFDMKGGMYLAVHAVEKLRNLRGRLNLPVRFMFIPDEEIGSPSTRALIEAAARRNKYVLVPEPGKPDFMVTGRHAFLRYKLHVYGKPAHAGIATGVGRSSISVMARLIGEIEGFSDVDREVTYRVGNIQGGTFVNVIPTECHAEVLCVAPTPEDFEEIQERMAALVSPDPEVELVVEPGPVRPLFQAHPGTMELLEVAQRIAREVGLDLGNRQVGGGSDGNFTGALGIPTLDGLGVVGDGAHTKQEYLLVSHLEQRAKLFAGLVAALCDRNA